MSKHVKELITADLRSRFGELTEAVMIDCSTLEAEENRMFRADLREAGISVSVVKNTLIRRVFSERGIEFGDILKGPTAIVHGAEDAVTASKAVADWRKKNSKEIPLKAGLLDGEPLDEAGAEKLTKMPSTQEVRQLAVSAIAGPLTATVGVLANTLSALPQVVQAIADKQKEGE